MTRKFVESAHPNRIAKLDGFHELDLFEPSDNVFEGLSSLDVCSHGAGGYCEGIKDDVYGDRCIGSENYTNCQAYRELEDIDLLIQVQNHYSK